MKNKKNDAKNPLQKAHRPAPFVGRREVAGCENPWVLLRLGAESNWRSFGGVLLRMRR